MKWFLYICYLCLCQRIKIYRCICGSYFPNLGHMWIWINFVREKLNCFFSLIYISSRVCLFSSLLSYWVCLFASKHRYEFSLYFSLCVRFLVVCSQDTSNSILCGYFCDNTCILYFGRIWGLFPFDFIASRVMNLNFLVFSEFRRNSKFSLDEFRS